MTGARVPLACPRCSRSFDALQWVDEASARCRYCEEEYEVISFPALTRQPQVVRAQQVAVAEDSSCFFHSSNQAERVCDGCGRFICAVCSIPSPGGHYCPACLSASKDKETAITSRVLYGSMALMLAIVPVLIWPFTFVTAPITLGLLVYGWNKPGSLVRRSERVKLGIAGVIALAQVVGWGFVIFNLLR